MLAARGIPGLLARWMAAFLLDRQHKGKICSSESDHVSPNGGVTQGTLSGAKDFLVHMNDMSTPCPM